jgi:hypothetical protein
VASITMLSGWAKALATGIGDTCIDMARAEGTGNMAGSREGGVGWDTGMLETGDMA